MKYSEKLKDPRWQKKRLFILSRDEWTCQSCLATESTLHVHHKVYEKCDPWDYDDGLLVTLCDECHLLEPSVVEENMERLSAAIRKIFLGASIDQVAQFFEKIINEREFFEFAHKYSCQKIAEKKEQHG